MLELFRKNLFLLLLVLSVFLFFQKTLISGLLPIPGDTIVGLYYPFRDNYANQYPRGIPFKNFLITDPVRQLYPWKNLVIEAEKRFELPLWNPYNFSGTPLLANFQSSAFYPLNLLYFIFPYYIAWTVNIFLAPLFASLFMFLFLNNLKMRKVASFLGSMTFSLCGFSVAWLEWGNVVQTALWLPLILLSIDKIFEFQVSNLPRGEQFLISNKKLLVWFGILLFSSISSFFAGHLQIFFYIMILSFAYFIFRWVEYDKKFYIIVSFLTLGILFSILTFIQWYPTLQFISLSARNADLIGYSTPGWFIPWQNLIQFIAPDFFGNPTTLNYSGVWNYAEFLGYIGILPLIFALCAIFFRRDRNTIFFSAAAFVCIFMSLPNPISKIPFVLHVPFLETSQPTRLIFLVDFCLAILAALGLDYYFKQKKRIIYPLAALSLVFIGAWFFVIFGGFSLISRDALSVARNNLLLPSALFVFVFLAFAAVIIIPQSDKLKLSSPIIGLLLLITLLDLIRFGWKFEPFTKKEYLFPSSSIISFLQAQKDPFRVMSVDSQILPPNFSIMYHIQSLDGYDPLYLKRYGEFAAAYSRNKPDISSPFGFNRIITLQDYKSRLSDFLGAKYILSILPIKDDKLSQVFSDGKVLVYENGRAFPRAFFVTSTITAESDQDAINKVFDPKNLLNHTAIVQDSNSISNRSWETGKVLFGNYSDNTYLISSENQGEGFLVITDTFYPYWHVRIDGQETKIYLTDFAFRGIVVPPGKHNIEFYASLL